MEHIVASKGLSILPDKPVQSLLLGKHKSKLRGRGLDFEESRKYVTGDDIRNIDWRVTARTGVTHTKVFTEEKEKPCFIVTDLTPSMFFGSQIYTKSYIACQLAAISAYKILHNSDRFGGLIYGNKFETLFKPKRNRKAILQYFNELIERTWKLAEEPENIGDVNKNLSKALTKTATIATHDYLVIVISDFNRVSAEASKQLIQLSIHNDVILVKINDPLEATLPHNKMVLGNGDMQLLWQSKKKKAKTNYDKAMHEQSQSFVDEMRRYNVAIIELNTIEAIDEQLKNLYQK
ncbi:MAG: DUF58 domain-containing protein [Mangrovibacterium sp.]